MEDQGRHIAFISGGNLSKASYNKLNRYRNKLSKNYDVAKKKEIKNFISDLSKGEFNPERFENILGILHLIKNPVDEFEYSYFSFQKNGKFHMLQQFIQRNMYSTRLLKQLYTGRNICYNKIKEYEL